MAQTRGATIVFQRSIFPEGGRGGVKVADTEQWRRFRKYLVEREPSENAEFNGFRTLTVVIDHPEKNIVPLCEPNAL